MTLSKKYLKQRGILHSVVNSENLYELNKL